MQINYPPFLITAAHMSKLVVKDYQKTATEGQPRALYAIPTDLHSLLPIPSSNTPCSPLKIQDLSFFCPLSALCGVDRAELPVETDQGTGKQPRKEDRTKYAHALYCLATAWV